MARTVPGGRTRQTARRALDRRFEALRDFTTLAAVPRAGWIRAIREALGMTAAELGARMGTAETTVLRMERSESAGHVRLDTLQRAADALDCELVYALVPRRSLERMVDEQADRLARSLLSTVDHSMMLEDQRVTGDTAQAQLRDYADRLRNQPGLWRDAR